jgi:hypothetical protein
MRKPTNGRRVVTSLAPNGPQAVGPIVWHPVQAWLVFSIETKLEIVMVSSSESSASSYFSHSLPAARTKKRVSSTIQLRAPPFPLLRPRSTIGGYGLAGGLIAREEGFKHPDGQSEQLRGFCVDVLTGYLC